MNKIKGYIQHACYYHFTIVISLFLKIVSSNPMHGDVYLIQQYVIKFVSDWWQVGGFLRILRFPPPIKLTSTI